jgi:hypothetical protein
MDPVQQAALTRETARSLARWHDMAARRDFTGLEDIVAAEAVFRSPVANTPYPGQALVCVVLRGAMGVFEDFQYHRQLVAGDRDVCLEFSARIGDKKLKGIDLIKFDAEGRMIEFEVMVRPASGLQALGEAMMRSVGPRIKAALAGA